ncbi:MAG: methylated-DNA--[protein]-cysteine S-methyltransferase [Candidatus Bathyarchaeia archaeon]
MKILNAYLQKLEDYWVCLGYENAGCLRFLTASKNSREDALKSGTRWTHGEKAQPATKAPRSIRSVIESVEDLLHGRPTSVEGRFTLVGLPSFQKKALEVTSRIPKGKVATYADVAEEAGNPKAARAVGNAMANNPLPFIVPCHRVVKTDLSLGGYGFGIQLKKKILQTEGVGFSKASGEPRVNRRFLHRRRT